MENTNMANRNRDFAIDLMAIDYGLDSDEIDRLEAWYYQQGTPLVTLDDYIAAFQKYALQVTQSNKK
jgi:hypothetical protein